MIKKLCICLVFFASSSIAISQSKESISTPFNGIAQSSSETTVFINANIQVHSQLLLNNATLVVKGDKIMDVGTDITYSPDARIIDLKGKWIFASFIDLNSHYGVPRAKAIKKSGKPIYKSPTANKSHWNRAIHPEISAADLFSPNPVSAKKLRNSGFGIVLTHQKNGIARGSSVLVNLSIEKPLIQTEAAMHYSFSKGNSNQDYPSSMMGSIALLRQMFTDLDWYRFHNDEANISLEALKQKHRLPMFFESRDYQESTRAQLLAKESGRKFIVVSSGDDYKDLKSLQEFSSKLVIPIKPKKAIELNSYEAKNKVSLGQLYDWKYAMSNAYFLQENKLPFCITMQGCASSKIFFKSLQTIIKRGLKRESAIAALTTTPAKWIGQQNNYGKLEKGYTANFFISNHDVFTDEATVLQHWIEGKSYANFSLKIPDYTGKYQLFTHQDTLKMVIKGSFLKPQIQIKQNDSNLNASKINWDENRFEFSMNETIYKGKIAGDSISGFTIINGKQYTWKAIKTGESNSAGKKVESEIYDINNLRKAFTYLPSNQNSFIIKNVTVWTCDENGIVPNLDVYVKGGKILNIGENLNVEGVPIIDGTGKHLSPGLVDEHSHIAIKRGVNEGTQAITAEVRIEDVINADDVNIYRQVAGGTTTSHLLHGSANPIGGQTALIKMKYGSNFRELKFKTDHRFIKFALGENVKQSNWGDNKTTRFPQTRMGVEQVFEDAFTRTKKYSELRANDLTKIDWELEALNEIRKGKRHITCHSYQQGEINMLLHVADKHGFKVNTFTHVLEGYKIADKIKNHGAAASTFSDWWAYKFEVNDAIPFNAAILNEQGVLTGINSDDLEMGRRLNQEAAKMVKYGGVSEEDALKMVTINPAKMLHIDHKVGSITIGKDADMVLWSGNPLSIYSKVETTWIEGVKYFDLELDKAERIRVAQEKEKLIAEMQNDKGSKKKFKAVTIPHYHCDTIGE